MGRLVNPDRWVGDDLGDQAVPAPSPPPRPAPGQPGWITGSGGPLLSITRFRSERPETDGVSVFAPAQDAHLLIFKLTGHPAHDFWNDGRYAPAPASVADSLNILDLSVERAARLVAPFDSLHIHVPGAALDRIAEEAGAAAIGGLASAGWDTFDPVIVQMKGLILRSLERHDPADQLFFDHLRLALTAHVARAYGGMAPATRRRGPCLAPWQERRAKDLIAANLSKSIRLVDIARACELSLGYFSRAFKASTGFTPHGWLQACRVEQAKVLLRDSRLSLAEVAQACGFADQSHFTKIFTRATESGPGAWRVLLRLRRDASRCDFKPQAARIEGGQCD